MQTSRFQGVGKWALCVRNRGWNPDGTILRADLGPAGTAFALLFYNVVFLLPLAALLVVRLVLPARSEAIFRRVAALAERWGRPLSAVVLASLGVVFPCLDPIRCRAAWP